VTKPRRGKQLTDGQRQARDEFRRIAADHPDSLTIVADDVVDRIGALHITIRLPTGDLPSVDGGLPLAESEDIIVTVSSGFPLGSPTASVNHQRFAGHPHVLQGERLCIYLDPAREWHPAQGIVGFLERLWQWLADGAAARFDPTTALYHPVGGVLHQSPGTPTIVIRDSFTGAGKTFTRAYLTTRSPQRLDLTWTRPATRTRTRRPSSCSLPRFDSAPAPLWPNSWQPSRLWGNPRWKVSWRSSPPTPGVTHREARSMSCSQFPTSAAATTTSSRAAFLLPSPSACAKPRSSRDH
jgi:ubiquitin-protein ligase